MATKKPRTAKQLANDERLRQMAKDRKQQNDEAEKKMDTTPTNEPDIGELQKQVEELKAMLTQRLSQNDQAPQGVQVNNRGLLGTHVKYVMDKNRYANPIPRLFDFMESAPHLRQVAFRDSWELDFDIRSTQAYERIDGVREVQPQFTLKLIRIIYDEDNKPTNKRYSPKQMIFFEDPETAIVVARENGLEVDETNEQAFLDEMRYLRMRDWLVECFYPKPPETPQGLREEVIGNQRVTVYEVASEKAQDVFDHLKSNSGA